MNSKINTKHRYMVYELQYKLSHILLRQLKSKSLNNAKMNTLIRDYGGQECLLIMVFD